MIRQFETGATRDTDEGKLDFAWAAGFFDGEGSTVCSSNNGNKNTRIHISIGQKNNGDSIASVLVKFQSIFKNGKLYQKAHHSRDNNQHQYLVTKPEDVCFVLRKMWPYLGEAKKTQALLALNRLRIGRRSVRKGTTFRKYRRVS